MIRNLIDGKQLEEAKAVMKKMEEEMQKYLKFLKKLQSTRKSDVNEDKSG